MDLAWEQAAEQCQNQTVACHPAGPSLAACTCSALPDMCAAGLQSNIELDRSMAALEDGYSTALVKLLQPELTTKSDVLVGAPAERIGQDFSWWWQ